MARRFAALCSSVLLLWPVCARAQGKFGDHIRDRDADETPRPAPPEPPPVREPVAAPFGSQGQWVVTGASGIGVGSTTWSGSKASSLSVTFSPGLDLFVVKNLSVGVSLNVAYSDGRGYAADGTLVETKQTTTSGGARLGVNLPIARRLSLYPRLTAGYQTVHTTEQDVTAGSSFGSSFDAAHDGPWGAIDVPLVFVPKPQFFVAIVPGVTVDAAGGGQGSPGQGGAHTTGGAGFLVGGWFGGPPPQAPEEPAEAEPAERLPRFGDAGVVALSSELLAYGSQTVWNGADSLAYTSYGFDAGVDYFVADHVSIGAALWWMQSSTQGVELRTATTYTNHDSRAGGAVRAGVEWPLGPHLSLYPKLTLGFAGEDFDLESAGKANKGHDDEIYASAYVPLLVHVARHVFVGFGPSALADLSRTVTPGNTSNKATSVGASLTVGGWL